LYFSCQARPSSRQAQYRSAFARPFLALLQFIFPARRLPAGELCDDVENRQADGEIPERGHGGLPISNGKIILHETPGPQLRGANKPAHDLGHSMIFDDLAAHVVRVVRADLCRASQIRTRPAAPNNREVRRIRPGRACTPALLLHSAHVAAKIIDAISGES
jgi:hypothetical protein